MSLSGSSLLQDNDVCYRKLNRNFPVILKLTLQNHKNILKTFHKHVHMSAAESIGGQGLTIQPHMVLTLSRPVSD